MYIGALDQGTTSTRFMVFDRQGREIARHQLEHRQIYPRPGWVEHDPLEIWARTQEAIQGALAKAGVRPGELAALGITNQRETTVVWNKNTGEPYHNAIVWQDTRTDAICEALKAEGLEEVFRKKTGLPLSTYFSGPKLKWILDHVPGVREAAERGDALFGTVDTWLIWWLTGGPKGGRHVTDVTNASRTLLMNLKTLDWDEELLALLGIPRAMLPEIRPSSDPNLYGTTDPDGPLGRAVPVAGALGDQQAALVGQACFLPGEAKNTYGTGCFLLLNTGETPVESTRGLLTTVAYRFGEAPAVYALEGSIAIAGALVQWLRDNLDFFDFSHHIEDYARTVEDSGGVYIVPAFSGLFAPYWDPYARGTIVGLTRYATKGHLCRAALESVAYQTKDVLLAMEEDAGLPLSLLKVDGGMVKNELLMQFQADLLGVPVVRPQVTETTALGAAYAAGLAVGYWKDLEELKGNWRAERTFTPGMAEEERARLYAGWKRAVERSLGWARG
ncbi:glycerol kinase [Thermus oshimai JL-2]|uniref:Glycerol kinase n=1 Tax=Thermus oshimai JL-2 TaxID=751945 RepID=K7R4P6_THEOS|nr:glycerol kinase GlpK [Thermus oshimai]AFV75894.1 glycerol kinase [Thermus oshimai JL-2]